MPSAADPLSRRQLLAAGGSALAIAAAGCVGESSHRSTTEVEHDASERPDLDIDSSHEYESLLVRSQGNDHFVFPDEEAADAEAADDDPLPRLYRTQFVVDEDDAAALVIDADDETEREIRAFVDDTDFEAQSIVIEQRTIDDCYERRILGITAGSDSFRTQYCQRLKAPETACEADLERMEAIVLRVDRPYDDRPRSSGSSESMSCHGDVFVAESAVDRNATDTASNSSDAAQNTTAEANGRGVE